MFAFISYALPNLDEDPDFRMLVRRKAPEQIWFGLNAGWVVNLKDETIYRPVSVEAKEYYEADHVYGGSLTDLDNVVEEMIPSQKEKAAKSTAQEAKA